MEKQRDITFTEIRISNYKNLRDASLKVSDLSVLVGRNNSGKSNFFEIISLMKNLFLKGQEGKQNIIRQLNGTIRTQANRKRPTIINLSYLTKVENDLIDVKYTAEIEVTEDKLLINTEHLFYKSTSNTGPQKKLFERENNKLVLRGETESGKGTFKEHPIASDVATLEILPSLFLESESITDSYRRLVAPILLLAESPIFKTHGLSSNYMLEISDAMASLNELEQKKDYKFKLFKESMCEILDLEELTIHKVDLPPEMKEKYFYFCFIKERYGSVPALINQMSDGTRVLFLMLYHLFISDSPIVFIDEPEIGLHPNAISRLFDLFTHNKVIQKQVVMATHSAFLLNLLDPKNVTLAEPDETGFSTFKPVSEIEDLYKRLKSKYVSFGDLFADNFKTRIDTTL